MSILIKGMEMPRNCLSCPLQGGTADCRLTQKTYNWGLSERPSDCPLVPVPPHGDLIDRKTAYDSIFEGMVMTGYQSRALDCINEFYVPTIIPEEEGE